MRIRGVSVYGVGLLAVGLAGCGMFKKEAGGDADAGQPAAAVAIKPAPMSYVEDGNGLPTSRIWKSQMAIGDVNGDGFPDLGAISRLADGPWIFVTDGKGNWQEAANGLPREPYCGGGMDFMDVNKDGFMDVAVADHCKGVFVYLGDGKGNWRSASSGLPTIGAEDVALGDFNNDGCPDLASVAAAEEGVRAFRGNCKGVWKESSDGLALTDWGNAVEMVDINGDGIARHRCRLRGRTAGLARRRQGQLARGARRVCRRPTSTACTGASTTGDLNGDGRIDLVAGSQMPPLPEGCGAPGAPACAGGGVEAFLQQADGTWVFANEGFLPMNSLGVAIGDLNNDKKPDVVAVGKRALDQIGGVYGVYVFLGDGTGKWTPVAPAGLPQTGKERTWGVGAGRRRQGRRARHRRGLRRRRQPDLAVGRQEENAQAGAPAPAAVAPQRGKFGSIAVGAGS